MDMKRLFTLLFLSGLIYLEMQAETISTQVESISKNATFLESDFTKVICKRRKMHSTTSGILAGTVIGSLSAVCDYRYNEDPLWLCMRWAAGYFSRRGLVNHIYHDDLDDELNENTRAKNRSHNIAMVMSWTSYIATLVVLLNFGEYTNEAIDDNIATEQNLKMTPVIIGELARRRGMKW